MRARPSSLRRPRGRCSAIGLATATALVAGLLTLLLPGGAHAGIVAHDPSDETAGELGANAIEQAKPRAMPQVTGAGAAGAGGGGSGSVSSLPPAGASGGSAAGIDSFESHQVPSPTAYPNSANGKLFGRIPWIGAYSCSASVVRTRNRSVIFTAGHCVKEPGRGGWARHLTFIPAYADGQRPFGSWTWRRVFTPRRWAKHGNSNFDYAAIVLRRDRGRRVGHVTGTLGFAFGARRNRKYRAVGYPVNRAQGQLMWECRSTYEGPDPFYFGPGPVPLGIGCDMLNGSSGGGWTIAGNRLASLSSFGLIGRPDELYGPRFTRRANQVRLKAGRMR